MSMRTLVLIAGLVVLAACKSPKSDDVVVVVPDCICGSPEAAVVGCPFPACARAEGNPDNPECVCASLTIDEE